MTATVRNRTTKRRAVSVDVQSVSKVYGNHKVLDDISFHVEPGEIFVIMGPSGAGKSVLLKNIIGLEAPTRGKIFIDSQDASDVRTHRSIVTAIVFQAGALFNSMTVFENLALYPREHNLYAKNALREKVNYTLNILNLDNTGNKYPSELSGGMRKRVAIARALMMEPQLLLYDEPTSELDPVMSANITEVIGTLKEELDVTTLVVSHDRDLALSIGNRVALIVDGRIQTIDAPENLKQSSDPIIKDFLNPKIDIHNPRFRQLKGHL